jgi:hypothetical protein
VTASAGSRRLLAFGLVFLVLLGSWLRFHQISKNSFWVDELFTMTVALYHPVVPDAGQPWFRQIYVTQIADGDTFLTVKAGEQSPPLHDLLVKASVQTLGDSEFAARLPGALLACLLLAWCAWLAWREKDDWVRSVLCWTLLLLVFFPVLVIYAKDARAYSLGVSMVGAGALQWAMRWRHGWRSWQPPGWAEIVPFTLACLAHYNATAMVAMLLCADALMTAKTRSRQGAVRLLVLGVVVLGWIAINARTILFTARGGVAWGTHSGWVYARSTVEGALAILHPPWLMLAGVLLVGVLCFETGRRSIAGGGTTGDRPLWRSPKAVAWYVVIAIIVLHTALAGRIAASAGMLNPRYYIFMIPFGAIAFAMLLAELRDRRPKILMAIAMVALAIPWLRTTPWMPSEDFRSMTRFAVQGADKDTLFVFPWAPNRDMYRVYLDRMLGGDSRLRMVGISTPEEVPTVCQRLAGARHVVVMGHGSGWPRMEEIYAACGTRWPHRFLQRYKVTFAEHWYADAPAAAPSR